VKSGKLDVFDNRQMELLTTTGSLGTNIVFFSLHPEEAIDTNFEGLTPDSHKIYKCLWEDTVHSTVR
jgi:hypothetical protein